MRTPQKFTNALESRKITPDMIEACAVSANVRAKIARNQERYYRNRYDYYNNEDEYREKKKQFYDMKKTLLSVVEPVCIHKEHKTRKVRRYECEFENRDQFNVAMSEAKEKGCFVREGRTLDFSGTDRFIDDYEIEYAIEMGEVVEDLYFVEEVPDYSYYLFWEVGSHSFHEPISEMEAQGFSDLEIIDIDQIHTEIPDITDLTSLQFVKKVVNLINSKDYQIVA